MDSAWLSSASLPSGLSVHIACPLSSKQPMIDDGITNAKDRFVGPILSVRSKSYQELHLLYCTQDCIARRTTADEAIQLARLALCVFSSRHQNIHYQLLAKGRAVVVVVVVVVVVLKHNLLLEHRRCLRTMPRETTKSLCDQTNCLQVVEVSGYLRVFACCLYWCCCHYCSRNNKLSNTPTT